MKRAILIAGGTVGGLGAVLAITPPQLSATSSIDMGGGVAVGTPTTTGTSASSSTTTTTATKSSKPVATTKATATKGSKPAAAATKSSKPAAAATKTTAPAATTAAPASASTSGTFTGPAVYVNYGTVQVKITVTNGKITDAVAVQAPSGKNDRYTRMAVPVLKQQTLAAQSANIQGASGASYTSYGWYKSLQGALADAGL